MNNRRKTDPGSTNDVGMPTRRSRAHTMPAPRLTRMKSMTAITSGIASAKKKFVKWKSSKNLYATSVGSPEIQSKGLDLDIDNTDMLDGETDQIPIGAGGELCKAIQLNDIQKVKFIVRDNPEIYAARAFSAQWASKKARMIANSPDDKGRTPLFKAMEFKMDDIAKVLLENGADISLKMRDGTGRTVLHEIAKSGYINGLKILTDEEGLETLINTTDATGAIPLHRSAQFDHLEVSEELIAKKSQINAQDEAGNTPLMISARWAAKRVLKLLLDAGSDITIRNASGKTALQLAVVPDCVGILRQAEHSLYEQKK